MSNVFESLYTYKAIITRWIDADTVILDIDHGFNQWEKGARCRLMDIQAPEREHPSFAEGTKYVNYHAPVGSEVLIRTYKPSKLKDKWGRYLVRIWVNPPYVKSLNEELLETGLVILYR